MKTLFLFLQLLFITLMLCSQTPMAFKYQAIARDQNGQVIADQMVSFRFSIIAGSESGLAVYTETWSNEKTNEYGLIVLEIGRGNAVSGDFSSIDWSVDAHFVKVEIDPNNGSNFQIIGTSQLLSVPYALHAITVSNVATDASLTGKGSPGEPLKIAAGGVKTEHLGNAAVSAEKLASMGASTGQVLKWNGSTWNPDTDLSGASQWTQTKFGLYYDGGNVGIGSNTTSSLLTLHGGSNHTDVRLYNNATGINTNSDGLALGISGTSPYDAWLMNRENGSLKLGTNNTERLTIKNNGDVQVTGYLKPAALVVGNNSFSLSITGIYTEVFNRYDENPLRISFPGIDPAKFIILNIEVGWIANGNGNFMPDRYRSLRDGIWYEYKYLMSHYVELYVYVPDKLEYYFMPVKVTYMVIE